MKLSFFSTVFATSLAFAGNMSDENNVNGDKVIVCEFDKVTKTVTVPLSSLVENCELIHFEDIDDVLLTPNIQRLRTSISASGNRPGSPINYLTVRGNS